MALSLLKTDTKIVLSFFFQMTLHLMSQEHPDFLCGKYKEQKRLNEAWIRTRLEDITAK